MTDVKHSDACREAQERARSWETRWPDHCQKCHGAGYHHTPGYFNYKAGYGEPPYDDPCVCIADGNCPRCGQEGRFVESSNTDYFVCSHCGWDERNPTPDMAYPDPDCWCAMEQFEEWKEANA